MLRNFHLPNPAHDGTPREDTFTVCNDEVHAKADPDAHQQIDVVGRAATVIFDCEHKSHVYVIHQLQTTDTLLHDLANVIPCNVCGNRMKVTLRSGSLPPIIKQAFGDGVTN